MLARSPEPARLNDEPRGWTNDTTGLQTQRRPLMVMRAVGSRRWSAAVAALVLLVQLVPALEDPIKLAGDKTTVVREAS